MNINKYMRQTATYWAKPTSNGYALVFGSPSVISCRWEDKQTLFLSIEGEQIAASSVVYTANAVAVGGFLILGNYSSTSTTTTTESGATFKPPDDAQEILAVEKQISLKNDQTLYKVLLR